ncbi:hypothetical protein HPB50_008841 [Hyalomma asiaticum]|uniref:Uncharacterized protein n=1 Tax=Hyalomma asiaticum TaxID=266040 RepID=A0ACB7RIB6_HYAAI|nr:hypothetical protein HPB50_008841 [Hyalomma asiaticum]
MPASSGSGGLFQVLGRGLRSGSCQGAVCRGRFGNEAELVLYTWFETGPGSRELRPVIDRDVLLNGAAHCSTSVCRRPLHYPTTNRATTALACSDQCIMPGGH